MTDLSEETSDRPSPLKRIIAISFGFGFGATLAVGAIIGWSKWYQSRPETPKPWDTSAIVASFVSVNAGLDKKLRFRYILENRSSKDYRLAGTDEITLMAKLESQKSFSGFLSKLLSIDDYPIFIPPGQRQTVSIRLPYSGPDPLPPNSTKGQKDEFARHLRERTEGLGNLDGFVLFDHGNRYQIDLPKGW